MKNKKNAKNNNNTKYITYILIALALILVGILIYIKVTSKPIDIVIPECKYDKTASETVYLKIDCEGTNLSNNYKKGDSFKCELLGDTFEITIKDIGTKQIKLESSSYGLFPVREDGTISLIDKVDKFTLNKCTELDLALQATDSSENIKIEWK